MQYSYEIGCYDSGVGKESVLLRCEVDVSKDRSAFMLKGLHIGEEYLILSHTIQHFVWYYYLSLVLCGLLCQSVTITLSKQCDVALYIKQVIITVEVPVCVHSYDSALNCARKCPGTRPGLLCQNDTAHCRQWRNLVEWELLPSGLLRNE